MRKRVVAVLLSLFCTVMVFTQPANAAGTEVEGTSKLKLHYYDKDQELALSNVTFKLYKVGEEFSALEDGTYSFKLTEGFAASKVELVGMDFWRGANILDDMAESLVPYAQNIAPISRQTDDYGDLTFGELEAGLYLVVGDSTEIDKDGTSWKTYTPQALLIPLPYPSSDGSIFDYDVTATIKYKVNVVNGENNIPTTDKPMSDLTKDDIEDVFSDVPLDDETVDTLLNMFSEPPLSDMTLDEILDLLDDDVPLADMTPEELVEFFEDLVPLVDAPQTGDNSLVWVYCAIASGVGLICLCLIDKRRKSQEK